MRRTDFDVVVVGGGVLGTAVAARLSRTSASVCLLEAEGDLAEGASKGNAGVASAYYSGPGTLNAEMISASYPRWEQLAADLDVPYRRTGAVMAALSEEELAGLPAIRDEARACGVRCDPISGDEARAREPLISPSCLGGLWFPDEGVIDPMRLTIAFAELAVLNGADLRRFSPVVGFDRDLGRLARVHTPQGTIGARFVVNAAGLGHGRVSDLAGGEAIPVHPRRGEYWLLDRSFGSRMHHVIFAAPAADTKGIHVVPTTSGTAILGPSVDEGMAPDDVATHPEMLEHVFERARRLVPSVSRDLAVKTYAANRVVSDVPIRVSIDRAVPNLLHVTNRSTGVSAAPGMADLALSILQAAGLDATDRPDARQTVRQVPRLHGHPQPETLARIDPRYGQVVCVCEQVSAAEIAAALDNPVPATSIAGVWKRTHATGGRCQGSVCMAGVAFMVSLATDRPPGEVQLTERATIGVAR